MKLLLLAFLLGTLPASPNPISAGNVQTEYGGANPVSFSEYYRGGAYVASGANTSIPTSGAISLHNFHGTTKPATALSASVTGSPAVGYCFYSAPATSCVATTDPATVCSGAGGTAPYTYSWGFVSGHAGYGRTGTGGISVWTHSSANILNATAVWRCTVTDAALATATVDVTVDMTNELL